MIIIGTEGTPGRSASGPTFHQVNLRHIDRKRTSRYHQLSVRQETQHPVRLPWTVHPLLAPCWQNAAQFEGNVSRPPDRRIGYRPITPPRHTNWFGSFALSGLSNTLFSAKLTCSWYQTKGYFISFEREREGGGCLYSAVYLSLSHSHTHTHWHTHQQQQKHPEPSPGAECVRDCGLSPGRKKTAQYDFCKLGRMPRFKKSPFLTDPLRVLTRHRQWYNTHWGSSTSHTKHDASYHWKLWTLFLAVYPYNHTAKCVSESRQVNTVNYFR